MSERAAFEDPILGAVSWSEDTSGWQFALRMPSGRPVTGGITVERPDLPLQDQGLDEIRACVAWARDHEPEIRQYIADQSFEGWWESWYDPEIDEISTKDEFREAIALTHILVFEDRSASLYFDDGGLYSGHRIEVSVGTGGSLEGPPVLWG